MRRRGHAVILAAGLICSPATFAQLDDVGYSGLQNLLGAATPTGAGVNVMHIEASLVASTDPTWPVYAPDTTNAAFAGKSFVFPGTPSTSPSGHATGVGSIYYGIGWMAYGVDNIACYEADEWIGDIQTVTAFAPIDGSRITNDSWVGQADDAADNATLLRLVDRETQIFEWIQVVGMPYGPGAPLVAGGFNVIAVGETAATNFYGSDALDSIYVAGRARPDLVAPVNSTSDATPLVASAAALLIETAHNGALSLSSASTSISGAGTVYDAERAMTIRVALMAGADRFTNNTSTTANVTDYGEAGYQASNGLDVRYGAGQLDILNSYRIIAAGEQHSMEDSGAGGYISASGFDFDAAFGGDGRSNSVGTYRFTAAADATLAASLGWYLGVSDDANLATTLHHLTLTLLDTTDGSVVSSASTIDNTQNLWVNVSAGHQYTLRVNSGESSAFNWQYALAWNITSGLAAPITPPVMASTTFVDQGGSSVLSASAVGSGTFSYQWYQGTSGDTSNPIPGATGATFTTPALSAPTSYWVQITNGTGTIQNSATVAISVAAAAAFESITDGPMPPWALAALAVGLMGIASRRLGQPMSRK